MHPLQPSRSCVHSEQIAAQKRRRLRILLLGNGLVLLLNRHGLGIWISTRDVHFGSDSAYGTRVWGLLENKMGCIACWNCECCAALWRHVAPVAIVSTIDGSAFANKIINVQNHARLVCKSNGVRGARAPDSGRSRGWRCTYDRIGWPQILTHLRFTSGGDAISCTSVVALGY